MAKNPLLHRLTAVTAIVVAAGAALAGCSSSSGGNTSSSGSPDSIVLGSPGVPPVISGLLPYIADKQGFYWDLDECGWVRAPQPVEPVDVPAQPTGLESEQEADVRSG